MQSRMSFRISMERSWSNCWPTQDRAPISEAAFDAAGPVIIDPMNAVPSPLADVISGAPTVVAIGLDFSRNGARRDKQHTQRICQPSTNQMCSCERPSCSSFPKMRAELKENPTRIPRGYYINQDSSNRKHPSHHR